MKHVINKLSGHGHSTVKEFDPSIPVEIKSAEEVFNQLKLEGHHMADISDPQKDGTELKVFDPTATEILAIPQLVGG